jgi:hypothetical protein
MASVASTNRRARSRGRGRPGRTIEVFQRLTRLEAATVGAKELTPEEVPFLRFDPAVQELFDSWRADLEQALVAMLGIGVWRWHRRVVTEDGEPAKGRNGHPERSGRRPMRTSE